MNEISYNYAPVICILGPLGAGDIAGLKCRNLTSDVSRQCRGCAAKIAKKSVQLSFSLPWSYIEYSNLPSPKFQELS